MKVRRIQMYRCRKRPTSCSFCAFYYGEPGLRMCLTGFSPKKLGPAILGPLSSPSRLKAVCHHDFYFAHPTQTAVVAGIRSKFKLTAEEDRMLDEATLKYELRS